MRRAAPILVAAYILGTMFPLVLALWLLACERSPSQRSEP